MTLLTAGTTFFGSAGVPPDLAGGASTSVPSGILITLLTTFFGPGAALPGAAPGVAIAAGPLVGALGGAALISFSCWFFSFSRIAWIRGSVRFEFDVSAPAA